MIPKTSTYDWIQLPGDINKPADTAKYLESIGCTYVFGGKDQALLQSPTNSIKDDLEAITGIDCSGFVGVVVWHMAEIDLEMKNSQMIGQWADAQGFKKSTPEAARDDRTGNLYLFVLPSTVSGDGIGHTGFAEAGLTAESYGHHGPGQRAITAVWDWFKDCEVWVLRLGQAAPV